MGTDYQTLSVRLGVEAGMRCWELNTRLPTTIGSSPTARLRMAGATIAPLHCEIYQVAHRIYARTLSDQSPITVNYQPVLEPVPLEPHDVISVGPARVRFLGAEGKASDAGNHPTRCRSDVPRDGSSLDAETSDAGDPPSVEVPQKPIAPSFTTNQPHPSAPTPNSPSMQHSQSSALSADTTSERTAELPETNESPRLNLQLNSDDRRSKIVRIPAGTSSIQLKLDPAHAPRGPSVDLAALEQLQTGNRST